MVWKVQKVLSLYTAMESYPMLLLAWVTALGLLPSVSAQIGLDWNKLKEGNSTNLEEGFLRGLGIDTGAIESLVQGLLDQLENIRPSGDLGGYRPDENTTIIPDYVTEEDGGDSPLPSGFEALAYVSPVCMNHTITAIQDFFDQKSYAVKSKFQFL